MYYGSALLIARVLGQTQNQRIFTFCSKGKVGCTKLRRFLIFSLGVTWSLNIPSLIIWLNLFNSFEKVTNELKELLAKIVTLVFIFGDCHLNILQSNLFGHKMKTVPLK